MNSTGLPYEGSMLLAGHRIPTELDRNLEFKCEVLRGLHIFVSGGNERLFANAFPVTVGHGRLKRCKVASLCGGFGIAYVYLRQESCQYVVFSSLSC